VEVTTNLPAAQEAKEDGDQEFEFRLFSTSNDTTSKQKIVLSKDDEAELTGDGAILKARDSSYYFAVPATGRRKGEFDFAAVSGEDVMGQLKVRYRGLEVPWRVQVIRVPGKVKNSTQARGIDGHAHQQTEDVIMGEGRTKKKLGKKIRILFRQRKRAANEAEEKAKRETQDKEAAEREKKTRRNKEKQLKKRAKEKAEKAAKRAEAEGGIPEGTATGITVEDASVTQEG
jgi:hypothetical protein